MKQIFRKEANKQTSKSHQKKKPTQASRSKRFKNSCKIWQCWWYFRWSSYCRTGQFAAIDITVVSFSFFQWLHFRQNSINLLCHHIFLSSSGLWKVWKDIVYQCIMTNTPCPTLPNSSIYSAASAQPNTYMRSCSTLTWNAEFWAAVQKGKKLRSVREMFRCKPIYVQEHDFQVQNQRRWE